jgi:hypothetical protein
MATLRATASSSVVAAQRPAARFAPLPAARRVAVRAQAQKEVRDAQSVMPAFITAGTLGSLLAAAPSAHAAAEVMQLAGCWLLTC